MGTEVEIKEVEPGIFIVRHGASFDLEIVKTESGFKARKNGYPNEFTPYKTFDEALSHNDRPAEVTKCAICGEPMPPGEEAFQYHGFSGPCPKGLPGQPAQSARPVRHSSSDGHASMASEIARLRMALTEIQEMCRSSGSGPARASWDIATKALR